ncbi:hypothetical protein TWF694_009041 [Orbilia ellipsospora]|uniref:Alpha-type protein kinase domain-containing protein n=1 Tax=Orbilia ellipsospora TaxID=2528407 RepID=A0AAV9XEN4_9PEZI
MDLKVQDSRLSATVYRPRPSSHGDRSSNTLSRLPPSTNSISASSSLPVSSASPALISKAKTSSSHKKKGSTLNVARKSFHSAIPESESLRSQIDAPKSSGYTNSSATTTTRTRERLRDAEEELERLRHRLELQRAVVSAPRDDAENLQYENHLAIPVTDIEKRIRDLKLTELKAKRGARRRSNVGLFNSICSTDLLFLLDTTGSMGSYIDAAKQQIRSIVSDIKVAFFNEADVRIAVVGYKDHGDSPNIQFLDFTSSVDHVLAFLNILQAVGGNDAPEDVLGGVQKALGATWKYKTRCIVHIADAPPHGRIYHDLGDSGDRYSNPGSEPHSLKLEPLIEQMIQSQINYTLLRINNTTDRMAYTFSQVYAAASADCSLHPTNRYYSSVTKSRSKHSATGKLLMHEASLGITFDELRNLVVRTVTSSASGTAARHLSRASKPTSPLTIIKEDENQEKDNSPQWDALSWFQETLVLNGFCPDVTVHGAHTLDNMMADDDYITMSVLDLTVHKRRQPFAQGGLRLASYARTAASTNRYVVKSSRRDRSQLAELVEGMRCQALCKLFALEFNALLGNENLIDFIVTACFKGISEDSGDTCISLEPFIEGEYVKYNNNAGYVHGDATNKFNKAAQAFSHFTFERSRGRFLVCDLQGVGGLLTDPVVHTSDPDRFILSPTNFGEEGFKFFFASHKCNNLCQKLELKSNATTFASATCAFKENWPSLADTVCCSNKLCGKILHRATGKRLEKLPGYTWCDACWPQLESSVVNLRCAVAPYHVFPMSRFFCESQGQNIPRKCFEHRGEVRTRDSPVISAKTRRDGITVADERLWGSLRSANTTGRD